jgi:hypothetical protein
MYNATYLASSSTLAQHLGHQAILQVAEPSTLLEVVPRQEHIPQSQLLGLDLEILNDRWMCAEPGFGGGAELLSEDGIRWYAFFLDELLNLSWDQLQLLWNVGTANVYLQRPKSSLPAR